MTRMRLRNATLGDPDHQGRGLARQLLVELEWRLRAKG